MSQMSSPPKKVVLNLNVYLTPTYIEHLGGSLEEAKIKAAQAVADFFFNHKSLNTNVDHVHGNRFY